MGSLLGQKANPDEMFWRGAGARAEQE